MIAVGAYDEVRATAVGMDRALDADNGIVRLDNEPLTGKDEGLSLVIDPDGGPLGRPDVWVTGFVQPERSRTVVSALRPAGDAPAAPEPTVVRSRLPEGSGRGVIRKGEGGHELSRFITALDKPARHLYSQ
ncbi:MAG TPA: hypothetical protein VFT01_11725 [Homoserinimonas sp.]|nr:hypothetical protein [Homoserinimonas sp.]